MLASFTHCGKHSSMLHFNKKVKTIHHFRDKSCRKLYFQLNYSVINESHKAGGLPLQTTFDNVPHKKGFRFET